MRNILAVETQLLVITHDPDAKIVERTDTVVLCVCVPKMILQSTRDVFRVHREPQVLLTVLTLESLRNPGIGVLNIFIKRKVFLLLITVSVVESSIRPRKERGEQRRALRADRRQKSCEGGIYFCKSALGGKSQRLPDGFLQQ